MKFLQESSVVVYPEYVTLKRDRYCKGHLTFFRSSITLKVYKKESDFIPLTFEWKTVDLISIESRWLEPVSLKFQFILLCISVLFMLNFCEILSSPYWLFS